MPVRTTFIVTQDHIKLLKNAYVRWEDCEYGAPAIDCKRPYGNSGVENDIAEILDWDIDVNKPLDRDRAYQIHKETQTVLQIFLETGKMETGTYHSDHYGTQWVKE